MCLLESDLENQLGEFHIRMKGKNDKSGSIFESLYLIIFHLDTFSTVLA